MLTAEAKKRLSKWGRLRRVATGVAFSRLADEKVKKEVSAARKAWIRLRLNPFFLWGVGLYAGDGNRRSLVLEVTNADFDVIRTWLDWIKQFVGVDVPLRARIVVHSSDQVRLAEGYWSGLFKKYGVRLAGVDAYISSASGKRRPAERLPYGTVHVVQGVGSRFGHARMMEWIRLANTPGWRKWKRSGL